MSIRMCGCTSNSQGNTAGAEFQDKQYGRGNRIYTDGGKEGKKIRCTVCGKVIETGKKDPTTGK